MWADSQNADFASTVSNQLNVSVGSGIRFETGGVGVTVDGSTATDEAPLQSFKGRLLQQDEGVADILPIGLGMSG